MKLSIENLSLSIGHEQILKDADCKIKRDK